MITVTVSRPLEQQPLSLLKQTDCLDLRLLFHNEA